MRSSVAVFTLLLLTVGCVARPVSPLAAPAPVLASVDVDELMRRGCYRCLETAFDAATASNAAQQTFEVALLLAARAKELGLPAEPWLARARAVLPVGSDWAMYLDIVEAQQQDPLSGDRDVLLTQQFDRRLRPVVYAEWRERLKFGPGSALLRAYLELTIACRRQQFEGRDEATGAVLAKFGRVPLLQYRAGLCGGEAAVWLAAVRDAEAEFVDADLELGRRAAQERLKPDVAEALHRLRSARLAFPTSPIIPVIVGDLHRGREEWPEALAEYDATLALAPTHRDALLGRTISLSHLLRHADAIESATKLLELGNWFLGEAHYWRAWNEYQLDQIQAARVDTDRAKTLTQDAPTFILSGMIEWREKRLEAAEREFQEALTRDFGQCEAAFFLGGVRAELQRWPQSISAFQHAERCFELSIVTRREAIAELSVTRDAAALNARQIASHDRAIADAQKHRDEAAQNVASIQKLLAPAAGGQAH